MWKDDLDKLGFAVVTGVLNKKECEVLVSGFWAFWNKLSKGDIRRHDKATWKNIHKWYLNRGMLGQHFAIGHMPEIWAARSNPKVIDVFERVWGTRDLTCSIDGAATSLQPEVTGRGWHRDHWLHLDQSPTRSAFECVQGWVTGLDIEEGDGTLTVLAGSHLLHEKFAEHFELNNDKKFRNDWFKLRREHVQWYIAHGCVQRFVECPRGSMVLWDSRTVHAGRAPVRGRKFPKNRMVAYICMLPRHLLRKKGAAKKRDAVLRGRMTSHWPATRVRLFGRLPNTYGRAIPAHDPMPPPFLSPRAASLAGWGDDPSNCPLTITDPVARKIAVDTAVSRLDHIKETKRVANRATKARRAEKRANKKQRTIS